MRSPRQRRLLRSLGDVSPALDVLWSYRRRPATDLNAVKAARAAMTWRIVTWPDMLHLYFRYLRWLFHFPTKVAAAVGSYGKETRQRYGRSVPGQIRDILKIALVNGLRPLDYYRAALARHDGGNEIYRYPPFILIRITAERLTAGDDQEKAAYLKNKTAFERRCRAAGVPVVRTVAIARETGIWCPDDAIFEGPLPDRDLIIKLESGGQGRGTESWRSVSPGQFANADGDLLSSAELLKRAASIAKARDRAVLVQERLENHPELRPISGSALSTTRVVTMFNEAGVPEIVDAFYRTSIKPDAAVDNFHNGGVLFPIDLTTGRFLPGMADAAFDQQPIMCHPQTGTSMVDRVHPRWQEVAEMALRLHHIYSECIMPGWDIAVAPDGVVAIELNMVSGISINRQPQFGGLVGTRLLSLLAFHANAWLERNEPPTSRWRVASKAKSMSTEERASALQAASATSRSPNSSVVSPEKNRRSHNSRLMIW